MATKEERNKALKAFKKRLRVLRRDDESSLGGGPLSGGRSSGICGIALPEGHSAEAWQELIDRERIRQVARDSFELVPQKQQKRV